MCTMAFNKFFAKNVKEFIYNNGGNYEVNSEEYKLCETYKKAVEREGHILIVELSIFQRKRLLTTFIGDN